MWILQRFENFQDEVPGAGDGGDAQAFPAGVDIVHLRADGNGVQTGQLFAQKAAFQAGMNGNHFRLFAIEVGIDLHHGVPQEGVFLILPGRVFTGPAVAAAELVSNRAELGKQCLLFLIDGAADGERQL